MVKQAFNSKLRIFMCHCSKSPEESPEQGRNASRLLTHFNDKSLYRD